MRREVCMAAELTRHCFVPSIIAIHGLDGHRENSWTAENGVLWLRDLLKDQAPTARVLTYGYDANTRGRQQLTSQTLYDHAGTFTAKLALFRKQTSVGKFVKSLFSYLHRSCSRRRIDQLYSWPIVLVGSSSNVYVDFTL